MAVSFEEFAKASGGESGGAGGGDAKWLPIFTEHPEGGGHFGGRDNALTALVGFLRAKSVPYEGALDFAQWWNQKYLKPPLDADVVHDKMGRGWLNWAEGGHDDATPEDFQPAKPHAIEFLEWDEMEQEEQRVGGQAWIVPGGIPAQGLVYITGAPQGGKSWVALDLIRAALTGGEWLGKYPVEQTKVLLIDEEMGIRKAMPRFRKIGLGPFTKGMFRYANKQRVRVDTGEHLEAIKKAVEDGYTLVIVDTLARIHGYDENDNSQMRKLFDKFQILMAAGATVVVLHHDRKGGQGQSSVGHDRSRGAGEIIAAADMAFGVEKHSGWYRLVTTKNRLIADDESISCDFIIQDNEDRTRVTLRPVDLAERSEMRLDSLGLQILTAVRDAGEMNTRALCDAVKGDTTAIMQALSKMVDSGDLLCSTGPNRSKIYRAGPSSKF